MGVTGSVVVGQSDAKLLVVEGTARQFLMQTDGQLLVQLEIGTEVQQLFGGCLRVDRLVVDVGFNKRLPVLQEIDVE